jgi:hypothetical protein
LCRKRWFGRCFQLLEPDLHTSIVLFTTRAQQRRSLSSSAPAAGSTGHIGRRSPTRSLHVLEIPVLCGAHNGHAPPFLAVHSEGWVLQPPIYGWVLSVMVRGGHAPSSPAKSASISIVDVLFWVFSTYVLCIPLVSLVQSVYVLLKFY